jgi:hypothetical protein
MLGSNPERDGFVALCLDELRTAGLGEPRYERDAFRIRLAGSVFYLGNAFEQFRAAAPADRLGVIRRYVGGLAHAPEALPEALPDALPNLLPRLRDRGHYDQIWYQQTVDGQPLMPLSFRPLAEHYAVELAFDTPTTLGTVSPERIAAWGLDLDRALDLAWPNLEARCDRPLDRVGPGWYVSPWDDDHDASRALMTQLVRACDVRGDPVVSVPNRCTLFVTGSEDETGLHTLVEHTKTVFAEPHAMIAPPLRLAEDGYRPFVTRPGDIGHEVIAGLRHAVLHTLYDEQKPMLERVLVALDDDAFVASLMSMNHPATGEPCSLTTWTAGGPTLLPRADFVSLLQWGERKPGRYMVVPWAEFIAGAAPHLEETDHYPPRWRTPDWLPSTVLDELARQSVAADLGLVRPASPPPPPSRLSRWIARLRGDDT